MDNQNCWANSRNGQYDDEQFPNNLWQLGSFTSLLQSGNYPRTLGHDANAYHPHSMRTVLPNVDQPWRYDYTARPSTTDNHNFSEYGSGENLGEPTNSSPNPTFEQCSTQQNEDDDDEYDNDDVLLRQHAQYQSNLVHTLEMLNAFRVSQFPLERLPFHTSTLAGGQFMCELLEGREERFKREMSMPRDTFLKICLELQQYYGWERATQSVVDIHESFEMFMHLLRGNSNREIQDRFQHSGETVSRHIHKILQSMIRGFISDKIRPTRSQDDPHPYLDRHNFYAPFKGQCIGAVDGTHVMVRCRKKDDAITYYGRKGCTTQNIMAVCDFDLTFVFVSAGWEGIMHDYAIFKRIIHDRRKNFPFPEEGKYYLVDSGYPNQKGFLAPYKGMRYHQADFRRGNVQPQNDKEWFNRAHSSLRSSVERTFGVWKHRFGFLANMPWYSMETQTWLILASMAIHNYIRRDQPTQQPTHERSDEMFQEAYRPTEYVFDDMPDADPSVRPSYVDDSDENHHTEDDPTMDDVRNDIRRAVHTIVRRRH